MANKEQLPLTIVLCKENGELVLKSKAGKIRLDQFLQSLEEGEKVEVTYEPIHGEVSYAQLSKLHKCIRVIAADTGSSFDDVKLVVKQKAGLIAHIDKPKSFSGLSKDEMQVAIQAVVDLGSSLGINLEAY